MHEVDARQVLTEIGANLVLLHTLDLQILFLQMRDHRNQEIQELHIREKKCTLKLQHPQAMMHK